MIDFQQTYQLNQQQLKKVEILKRLEKKDLKRKSFRNGLIFGFLSTYFMIGIIAFSLWCNKEKFLNDGLNFVISDYFENIVKAFPDGYITKNKERVLDVFDSFVNGAAKNRISKKEFKQIAKKSMNALEDGKLKYQELDNIINLMEKAVINSN